MWGQLRAAAPGTLRAVVAAIRLDFDPTATLFGLTVRLETLALASTILLVLVMAALGAGRTQARADRQAEAEAKAEADGDARSSHAARLLAVAGPVKSAQPARLRRDDLLLIAFGAVPGAVVGGRIDYGLTHLDYYLANPYAIFDPAQGGMGLTLAVVFGTIGAMAVARLLAAPIGPWLEVAAGPVLVGLGLGKLAEVLGGSGQGVYSDSSWATSYTRPGIWDSPNPGYPALPSQVVEGALVLVLAFLIVFVPFLLRLRIRRWGSMARPGLAARRDWVDLTGGRRFLTLIGLWAVVRMAAAFTWRDAQVLGPLGVEQLLLVAVIVFCLVGPKVPPLLRWLRPSVVAQVRAWRVRRAAFKVSRAAERIRQAEVRAAQAAAGAEARAAALAEARAARAEARVSASMLTPSNASDPALESEAPQEEPPSASGERAP